MFEFIIALAALPFAAFAIVCIAAIVAAAIIWTADNIVSVVLFIAALAWVAFWLAPNKQKMLDFVFALW